MDVAPASKSKRPIRVGLIFAALDGLPDGTVDELAPGVSAAPAAKANAWRLAALGVGVAAAIGAIVATALLVSQPPPPDATLQPSGVEPDEPLIALLAAEGLELGLSNPPGFASEQVMDLSTLRGFGTYENIELWTAVNAFESTCLIAVHRPSYDVIARLCAPAGADLFIDTREHGLLGGERLRFIHRGDTVDAYLLTPDEVG